MRQSSVPTLDQMLAPSDNSFGVLRLLLALAVVVSHSYYLATGLEDASEPLHGLTGYTLGQHAVQGFFILSGILVTQSLMRGGGVAFVTARALRIFPGLVVCVLVTAFVLGPLVSKLPAAAYFSDPMLPAYIADTLSLRTGLAPLPQVFDGNPAAGIVNSSLWTLKYEVACYLVLVVVGGLAIRLGRTRLIGFGLMAVVLVVNVVDRPSLAAGNTLLDMVQYFTLFFGTGVLAYGCRRHLKVHWSGLLITGGLLVVSNGTRFTEVGEALFLAYASIWVATFRFGTLREFANRNDFSFGVYIYGVPVAQTLLLIMPGLDALSLIALSLPIIVGLAAVSWRFVEKPALALRHRARRVEKVERRASAANRPRGRIIGEVGTARRSNRDAAQVLPVARLLGARLAAVNKFGTESSAASALLDGRFPVRAGARY